MFAAGVFVMIVLTVTPLHAVTREEILDAAKDFAELTWYADSVNTTAWDSMYNHYATLYGCDEGHYQSDWQVGNTYQGMAYGFGHFDDTVSYIEDLEQGLGAGNHMCHYVAYGEDTGKYPPEWTTGIDCSAFVSRVWRIPHTNTVGIYDKYYPVEKKDAQPGDALVWRGHHVVLVVDPGENPPYGTFALYEAAGAACRVWYNPAASWSSYSSYSARSRFVTSNDEAKDDYDTVRISMSTELSVGKGRILLRFPNAWETDVINYEIFNSMGRRVYTGQVTRPEFQTYWHGIDEHGRSVPSGIYGVRSISPGRSYHLRFVFLR